MSLRAKILLIVALGMLVAATVTLLAYQHGERIDQALNDIMTQDLGALRTIGEARSALRQASHGEDRLVSVQDTSAGSRIDRVGTLLTQSIREVRKVVKTELETVKEIERDTVQYIDATDALVISIHRARQRLHEPQQALRKTLNAVEAELSRVPGATSPTSTHKESRDALILLTQGMQHHVLGLREVTRATAEAEVIFEQRLSFLQHALDAFMATSSIAGLASVKLQTLNRAMAAQATALITLREKVIAKVRTNLARTKRLRESIRNSLDTLADRALQTLRSRRSSIDQSSETALSLMSVVMIGGLLLVTFVAFWITRSMTTGFSALLHAAREVKRGRLDTEVAMRSRDELHQLATAFNAMAAYYADRRAQQNDYNRLVSMLNRSLQLEKVIAQSIRDIVIGSDSDAGGVYLLDESEQQLVLADHYDMPQATTSYAMGEGLVGESALTRQDMTLDLTGQSNHDLVRELSRDTQLGRLEPVTVRCVPMVHLERLLGVILLASSRPYRETSQDLITESVVQVAVAIANTRFIETIKQTASELRDKTKALITQRGELEEANDELARANRLQSDFLANMTHELRTPLNAIIGFTELVLHKWGEDFDERPKRQLQIVLRNGNNLLRLINDLLDITKIEAGQVQITSGRVNLGQLAREVAQTITPMLKAEVQLTVDLPETMPIVWHDPGKLRQIFLNLLGNAAKFTEEGHIRVKIQSAGENFWRITVSDSGIGMSPAELPHIFDKFHQVDSSSSRKYGGTGLGLAITSELVRVLGGTISAESRLEAGSTFTVRLPVDSREEVSERLSADDSEALAPNALDPRLSAAPDWAIVLEVRPEVATATRRALEEAGIEAHSALDYDDAIALLSEATPCAVFLGQTLPQEAAEAAQRTLRQQLLETGVSVIILGRSNTESLIIDNPPAARLDAPITRAGVTDLIHSLALGPGIEALSHTLVLDETEQFTGVGALRPTEPSA